MRAIDYSKPEGIYTELTLEQKLRTALVEGMSPRYPEYVRERHLQLVKRFTGLHDLGRVETFNRFLAYPSFRKGNKKMFLDYLAQFEPVNSLWKPLPEREMAEAGVLVDAKSTDRAGLVHEIEPTYAYQVLRTDLDVLNGNPDAYGKRIPQNKVVLLNGKAVITQFAQGRIDLSRFPSFVNNGYIDNHLFVALQDAGFTFPAAVRSAIEYLKSERGRYVDFAALAVRKDDGNYRYIFPKDLVRGDELYAEIMNHRADGVTIEHTAESTQQPYVELDVYVPRMRPTKNKPTDRVRMKYLPNAPGRTRDMTLEWFRQVGNCDCHFSRDFRDRESIRGRTGRDPDIDDLHVRFALRHVTDAYDLDDRAIIYPTAFGVALLDKMRFNLHQPSSAKQAVYSVLFNVACVEFGSDAMFGNVPLPNNILLKPRYSGLMK